VDRRSVFWRVEDGSDLRGGIEHNPRWLFCGRLPTLCRRSPIVTAPDMLKKLYGCCGGGLEERSSNWEIENIK